MGSPGFFADLDEYHFEKLHHLRRLVEFDGPDGRRVLDVGCGTGVDLVHFARGGAAAIGIDVSETAIRLAAANRRSPARCRAPGRRRRRGAVVADATFDDVFAHGVVQYTADDRRLVEECRRMLKPGGKAFVQVYNRVSWLSALSRVMRVDLEHADAPVLRTYTHASFRRLLDGFSRVHLVTERFPVKSRLHGGWKGALFNGLFVGAFNVLPRRWVSRFGWHLIAICAR